MNNYFKVLFLSIFLSSNCLAEDVPYNEREFIKTFAGQDISFVRETLGEPTQKQSRSNASGIIEFWIYENIVLQDNGEKTFRYTQISLVNNRVESLGNTNRLPQ